MFLISAITSQNCYTSFWKWIGKCNCAMNTNLNALRGSSESKCRFRSAQGKNQLHCGSNNKHFQLLKFHSMTKAFGGCCQNKNQLSFVSHPKNEWSIWPCPMAVDQVILKESSFEVLMVAWYVWTSKLTRF